MRAARFSAFDQTRKIGVEIVNYLLDVYRYVTGAQHVERLPVVNVNRVYFADHNLVSEGASIGSGVGSAIVNRSKREIDRIKEMLKAGLEPERHVLLIQSAHAALDRGQLVLAIVAGFQALEILLEIKLRSAYAAQGVPESDITEKLKRCYKTKDRLKDLCREVAAGHSVADETEFWQAWLTDCNRKRNGVVHKNQLVSSPEALKVVQLCAECIARLSALPFST